VIFHPEQHAGREEMLLTSPLGYSSAEHVPVGEGRRRASCARGARDCCLSTAVSGGQCSRAVLDDNRRSSWTTPVPAFRPRPRQTASCPRRPISSAVVAFGRTGSGEPPAGLCLSAAQGCQTCLRGEGARSVRGSSPPLDAVQLGPLSLTVRLEDMQAGQGGEQALIKLLATPFHFGTPTTPRVRRGVDSKTLFGPTHSTRRRFSCILRGGFPDHTLRTPLIPRPGPHPPSNIVPVRVARDPLPSTASVVRLRRAIAISTRQVPSCQD